MKALTQRETEAVLLMTQGHSMESAARHMNCGSRTTRFHLDNARRKLEAINIPHLVAKFIFAQVRQEQSQ